MSNLSLIESDFRQALEFVLERTDALICQTPLNDMQLSDVFLIQQNAEYIVDIFDNPIQHMLIRDEYVEFVTEISQISHEFRTPLNAVIGFSTTLLQYPAIYDYAELTPEQYVALSDIQQAGWNMLMMLQERIAA